jgi:hypothetical protein
MVMIKVGKSTGAAHEVRRKPMIRLMQNRLVLGAVTMLTVVALSAVVAQATQYQPGEVIYDFNSNGNNTCYPDNWTFFGYPQTDFGIYADAEDGSGAFQAVDWTECDLAGYPQCIWAGSGVGLGVFNHPQCTPGGVADANLDLSLGTGVSVRMREDITSGFGGTAGARLQVQMVDIDGTTAVLPEAILANPAVDRMFPVPEPWTTVKFFFAGLDWAWDQNNAVAGNPAGLDLTHIKSIKFIWRRMDAEGANVYAFDKITLINDPPLLWADMDVEGDVDLADCAAFERCFAQDPLAVECSSFDADRDGDIDLADWRVLTDCMQGPGASTGFFAWCY